MSATSLKKRPGTQPGRRRDASRRNENDIDKVKAFTSLSLILLLLSVLGCDPAEGLTFVNEAGVQITVYSGGHEAGVIDSASKKTLLYTEYAGAKLFEARDAAGRLVYSEQLTWQDLQDRQWRIVIREPRP